jgi:nicotinamidase/pyrazinamidase
MMFEKEKWLLTMHPDHIMRETDLLLVIDVQRDFCHGGKLAVPDGDAVVPVIHDLSAHFRHIVLTQDWHPARHTSFASMHTGKQPFDEVLLGYGPQTLWPDHCVQNTPGAEFHPGLAEVAQRAELILRKGFRPDIDSYSAFLENDKQTPTGLAGYLRERGFQRIFLAGLAYDYCVRYSAIDAVRAGFQVWVIHDACRSVGPRRSEDETLRELELAGVRQVPGSELRRGSIE